MQQAQSSSKRLSRLIPSFKSKLNNPQRSHIHAHAPTTNMALFPRMSAFHAPTTRTPYRDDFTPFFSLLNDTFSELQRLSDTFPTNDDNNNASGTSGTLVFAPKFDVKETDGTYELQGELPGVARENLAIEFADEHTLTVKGRTEHSREQQQQQPSRNTEPAQKQVADGGDGGDGGSATTAGTEIANPTADSSSSQEMATASQQPQSQQQHTYWVTERSVGEFSRTFSFPHRVDRDGATASLKNGVLSVVVPKLAPKQRAARRTITVQAE